MKKYYLYIVLCLILCGSLKNLVASAESPSSPNHSSKTARIIKQQAARARQAVVGGQLHIGGGRSATMEQQGIYSEPSSPTTDPSVEKSRSAPSSPNAVSPSSGNVHPHIATITDAPPQHSRTLRLRDTPFFNAIREIDQNQECQNLNETEALKKLSLACSCPWQAIRYFTSRALFIPPVREHSESAPVSHTKMARRELASMIYNSINAKGDIDLHAIENSVVDHIDLQILLNRRKDLPLKSTWVSQALWYTGGIVSGIVAACVWLRFSQK